MKLTGEQEKIARRVKAHGQGHVLRWINEISEEERKCLFVQLNNLDFERVEELAGLIGKEEESVDFDKIEPADVERLGTSGEEVAGLGREALRADRVAALTVAGGQGTRLGYDGPKGTFPITPILGKSLFQVLAEKVLAVRQRYGCSMPWLIMTSPTNHKDTIAFFEGEDYFGMPSDSVYFFSQNVNPILGESGELLLKEKNSLLVGPDGHGGVFEAFSSSGLGAKMAGEGFDLISYFQVDNPLVTVADERFIGHHLDKDAEFSCKVIKKRDPWEGLGVAVLKDGHPGIVEYIDMPEGVASRQRENGELEFLFGSIAVHVINTEFALRMGGKQGVLPWHVAEKNYEVLHPDGSKSPSKCFKFERFVFDCLPYARGCAFVEAEREDEFAPVKNAEGEDSPDSCRRLLTRQWVRWLEDAGVDISQLKGEVGDVEIGPLYADSSEDLAEALADGVEVRSPVILD